MAAKDINTKSFIRAIEQRPAIWNSSLGEYCDKKLRKKMWEEIVILFGGNELDLGEKKELGVTLQKKWKNLRDSYFRETRRSKNILRSGSGATRKGTYIFYQQLSFLKATTNTKVNSIESLNSGRNKEELEPHQELKRKRSEDDTIGKEIVNVLKSSLKAREEDVTGDTDKMFLCSLLDDFKRIPQHSKNMAKIEMIKLIQKYHTPIEYHNNTDYPSSHWPVCDYVHPGPSQQRDYFADVKPRIFTSNDSPEGRPASVEVFITPPESTASQDSE